MSAKDSELGTLIVVILKARNLNDKHSFRKQDVFAQATLDGVTKKTHVDIKGGQHPVWDEELRFTVSKNGAGKPRKLEVACFAKEPRSDDLLGRGTIDISETLKTGEFDDWASLDIDGVARGDLYLEMTYYANSPAPTVAMGGLAIPSYLKEGVQRRPSKLLPSDRLSRPGQATNFSPPQNPISTGVRKSSLPKHTTLPPSLAPANASGRTASPNPRIEPRHSGHPGDVRKYNPPEQVVPAVGIQVSSLDSARNQLAAPPLPSILRPGSAQPPTASNSLPSGQTRQSSTAPPSLINTHTHPAVAASQPYTYGVIPSGSQNMQPLPYQTQNPYSAPISNNPYISPVINSTAQPRVDTVTSPTFVSGGFYFPVPVLSPARETAPYSSPYGPVDVVPRRETNSVGHHDPYLPTRYQTPLPLPHGSTRSSSTDRAFSPMINSDVARLETLRRVEAEAAQRRQQELKDLELALQLDRELNLA